MQIFVQAVGNTLTLDASSSVTVGEIASMVQAQTGLPKEELSMNYAGRLLLNDEPLFNCDVHEGSTLHIVTRVRGGGDGTPAMGKRHKHTHGLCPRCGKRSFHHQKKTCASCGYPAAKISVDPPCNETPRAVTSYC